LNSQQTNQNNIFANIGAYGSFTNLSGLSNPLQLVQNQQNANLQQQQANQNFNSSNSGYLNLSNGQVSAQQQNVVAAAAMAMFPGSFTSNGINLSDEHQVYEYLHQLLEEKEKLKELFNEPFNIMLPISARLLDEGKLKRYFL